MTKHTNPFYAINETISTLKSLGLDLYGIDEDATTSGWQEGIIEIAVSKKYEARSHYYAVRVHMTEAGFLKMVRQLDPASYIESLCRGRTGSYDHITISPVPLLEIFTLVPIGKEFAI